MRQQQVVTGAANDKPYAVAVGRFRGSPCVVYARAFQLVLLHGDDFGVVQIIAGPEGCTDVATCVQWCDKGGKIAAAYGKLVRIYEPTPDPSNEHLPYRWVCTNDFLHDSPVYALSWAHTGNKLLTGGETIRLYESKVIFFGGEESDEEGDQSQTSVSGLDLRRKSSAGYADGVGGGIGIRGRRMSVKDLDVSAAKKKKDAWNCVWETKVASPVYHLKYSPDSYFFASAGEHDRLVKVWWQQETDKSSGAPPRWTFVYLSHPRAVTGFSWREPGALTRRFNNASVLITSCRDNVARIWTGISGWARDLLNFHMAGIIDAQSLTDIDAVSTTSLISGVTASTATLRPPDTSVQVSWIPAREMCLAVTTEDDDESIEAAASQAAAQRRSKLRTKGSQGAAEDHQTTAQAIPSGSMSHCCRELPDFAFTVQPDGTLLVWRIEGVDEQPRCIPRISLASRIVDAIPPVDARTLCFEMLVYCSTDPKTFGDGHRGKLCAPSELLVLGRHANGTITKWRLGISNYGANTVISSLEYDTRCSGHSTVIKHLKAHPELPLLLSMGTESYRERGELIVWHVDRVRVMETTYPPLQSIARLKTHGSWDPALMSWFPHQSAFLAVTQNQLCVWAVTFDGESKPAGRSRGLQSFASVSNMGPLADSARHAPNMMSVHVFAVSDDDTHTGAASQPTHTWYYVVALMRDGITTLVWKLQLDPAIHITSSHVLGGPTKLPMPLGVSISYLTRPFTTRLQHVRKAPTNPIDAAIESAAAVQQNQDSLLLVSGCTDGMVRMWQCGISRQTDEEPNTCKWVCAVTSTPPSDWAGYDGDMSVKAASTWLVATKLEQGSRKNTVSIWECVTTGGYELRLEDAITFPEDTPILSYDWVDCGDGLSPILAIGAGTRMYLYTQFTSLTYQPRGVGWRVIQSFDIVSESSAGGLVSTDLPTSFRWAYDGSMVASTPSRMIVFTKWLNHEEMTEIIIKAKEIAVHAHETPLFPGSVFELANTCERQLPQYHPKQLRHLIMADWFQRANSILFHMGQKINEAVDAAEENPKLKRDGMVVVDPPPYLPPRFWDDISQLGLPKTKELERPASKLPGAESIPNMAGDDTFGQRKEYDELFSFNIMDDLQPFQQKKPKAKGVNLKDIMEMLPSVKLPGLTSNEQLQLMAQMESSVVLREHFGAFDANGVRAFGFVKLFSYMRATMRGAGPSAIPFVGAFWALHSESQDEMIKLCLEHRLIELSWNDLRAIRFGFWIKNPTVLKKYIEILARQIYTDTRQAMDCALWYLAMGKRSLLASLFRRANDARMADFLSKDYDDPAQKTKALKNAFVLLGKQRFQHAVGFFLLGGSLKDAVAVCCKNLNDFQLALVICRLYEGENGDTFSSVLRDRVLPYAVEQTNIPLQSICHWLLAEYDMSLKVLLIEPLLPQDLDANQTDQAAAPTTAPGGMGSRDGSNAAFQSPSISHAQSMAVLGSGAVKSSKLKAAMERASGLVELVDSDRERDHIEWYDPVLTECFEFLRHHVLLKNTTVNLELQMRRICEAVYACVHAGCPMIALDTLEQLRRTVTEVRAQWAEKREAARTKALGGSMTKKEMVNTGTLDMSAWGFDDDFADPVEKKPAVEDEEVSESEGEERVELMFTILTSTLSRDMCLRILIASLEQLEKEADWTVVRPHVLEDIAALNRMYGSGEGGQLMGVEDMMGTLTNYYRMHNDLAMEVKMLGAMQDYDAIHPTMFSAAKNLVLGIPHATYLRPPLTIATHDEDEEQSTEHADTYLLQQFRVTALALSDCVHQCLTNTLPQHAKAMRLKSVTFVSEMYIAVFSGLFVSAWWNKNLELMQTLLINAPSKSLFLRSFAVKDVGSKFHRNVAHAADSDDDALSLVDFTMDPKAPAVIADQFLEKLNFNDYEDDNPQGDTDSIDSTDSVKLLEEIFKKQPKPPTPEEMVVIRQKEEFMYGVLRLACVQFVTMSIQNFLSDMEYDFEELQEVSPLLYTLLCTFEAWTLQAELYVQSLPAPKNVLSLKDYYLEGEDKIPETLLQYKLTALYDHANNPYRDTSPVLRRLWYFMVRQESVRPLMMRFLFHEEFHQQPAQNSLDIVLFRDPEPINSFCINKVDSTSMAVATVKGTHWKPPAPHIHLPKVLSLHKKNKKSGGEGENTAEEKKKRRKRKLAKAANGDTSTVATGDIDEGGHYEREKGKSLLKKLSKKLSGKDKDGGKGEAEKSREEQTGPSDGAGLSTMSLDRKSLKEINIVGVQDASYLATSFEPASLPHYINDGDYDITLPAVPFKQALAYGSPSHMASVTGFGRAKPPGDVIMTTQVDPYDRMNPPSDFGTLELPGGGMHKSSSYTALRSLTQSSTLLPRNMSSSLLPIDQEQTQDQARSAGKSTPNPGSPTNKFTKLKKQLAMVTKLESHPSMPFYLSGNTEGKLQLWMFGQEEPQFEFVGAGGQRITSLHFDMFGNKFGTTDLGGMLSLWRFGADDNASTPFKRMRVHNKAAYDFSFLNSASFIATAGQSIDNRNVCLWDILVPESQSLIKGFQCHPNGWAQSLVYASGRQLLISGGRKGVICIFDMRQRRLLHQFQGHEGAVMSLAVDGAEECLVTGSSDGTIKIWNLNTNEEENALKAHLRHTNFLRQSDSNGVMEVQFVSDYLFSCGADGTVRRWS